MVKNEDTTLFDNLINKNDEKEWLTTSEAANYLGLTNKALYNMASNGHIPHYKLGRRNRYLKSELRELLSSQRRGVLSWE